VARKIAPGRKAIQYPREMTTISRQSMA